MLTSRGIGMLAAAVLVYAAARAFGISELQLTAVAAVSLVVAAVTFVLLTSGRLRAVRVVRPTQLHHRATAEVVLEVTNQGRLPTALLELEDQVPPGLGAPVAARVRPVAGGGHVTLRGTVTGLQRGRHQLGPVRAVLRDPFRLVARRHDLDAPGEVVVYPRVLELPAGLPLGGAQTASGTGAPRPLASGEDRSTIREYVQGDDLRGVHWPSTAHRGKLMVRQAEAPQDPRAVVVLDARADRHDPAGVEGSFETAVTVAASALFHLDRRGRGVVLLDGPLAGPASPRPAEGWLARLAEIAPHAADTSALWRQLGQGLAGDGALVAVLRPLAPTELRELVRAGRGFGTCTAVVIADAGGRTSASRGSDGDLDHAEHVVASLRAAGWRATVVSTATQLPVAWYELTVDRPTRTPATVAGARSGTGAAGGPRPGARPRAGRDTTAGPPPPPRTRELR